MTNQNPQPNPNGQYPGYPQQQPTKKPFYKKAWFIILMIIVVIIIIAAAVSGGSDDSGDTASDNGSSTATPAAEPQPGTTDALNTMTFILESDGAPINATYMGTPGNVTQEQGVPSGWQTENTFSDKWDAMGSNVSGQLDGSGSVTCRILWNGDVVSENTSTGDYAVVTCNPDTSKM